MRLAPISVHQVMKITVLLFAIAKEAAGSDTISIDVPENATAGDVLDHLAKEMPALVALIPSCRLAVDQQYVGRDAKVGVQNEVALIPPVSGG
jgi:molybdopterin converting factor subunit 1